MKGTEKQVAWATEIKERVNNIIDEQLRLAPSADHPVAVMLNNIKTALNDENCYAGDVIELFADVKNIRELASVRKVRVPMSDGQRKLLNR